MHQIATHSGFGSSFGAVERPPGGVAVAWAAIWSLLTTDVRRTTLLEGCGGPPEDAYALGGEVPGVAPGGISAQNRERS